MSFFCFLTCYDRCLDDTDDEVRDRAALALALMDNENISKQYVQDGNNNDSNNLILIYDIPSIQINQIIYIHIFLLRLDATFALPTLERQLAEYINSPLGNDQEFNLESVPIISKAQEDEERRSK